MLKICTFLILLFAFLIDASAQQVLIEGRVLDQDGKPVVLANIVVWPQEKGTASDADGTFRLEFQGQDEFTLQITHLEYQPYSKDFSGIQHDSTIVLEVTLSDNIRTLDTFEIKEHQEEGQPGLTTLDPISLKTLPSAFGEFSKALATLPGVSSNNELSSTYAVRGGNFDENLIYVNDILIYRPFLIRAGQQEGLSFINVDLIQSISFSAGGWQPKYGDKLSSNLNINYKKPTRFAGSTTLSLLGGATHIEAATKNDRINILLGMRYKSSRYLLGGLETKGQYLPRFGDIQSFINFKLGKKADPAKTELGLLLSYAANRYQVRPENRETSFGTAEQILNLNVYFAGQENLRYDTYQTGIILAHRFSERFKSNLIISGVLTYERENFDIEGAYRLCEAELDPNTPNALICTKIRGTGTYYDYGRNALDARILNIDSRQVYFFSQNQILEFGLGYSKEIIDDRLREYSFIDSADYVTISEFSNSSIHLNSNRFQAYIQQTSRLNAVHTMTYGVRANYWSFNRQWLISPRIQYNINPQWEEKITFKIGGGMYQQSPFYRELRNFDGAINTNIKAQSSIHAIAGMDYEFQLWNRDFKLTAEAYYKYLYHVIPYDVDNVRIRYYGKNNARAYAAGIDFRINGEFIKGAESWFSLGILTTKEDVKDDDRGYLRRPSDQLINIGVFFQDHFPGAPTLRMYLNLLYGSGLPFGPPDNTRFRNAFDGSSYFRTDIGLSKIFNIRNSFLKSVWIGVEVLNLLGNNNVISYTWIEDTKGTQFAIPNSLTNRFLNVKIIVKY